jgi:SAM-dependent methyltransferase
MEAFDVFNKVIEKKGYKKYLEIGIDNPARNFNKVKCEIKYAVEPYKKNLRVNTWNDSNVEQFKANIQGKLFEMTSDEFFAMPSREKFDLIFIDGLHLEDQVDRDIENSLKRLKKGGVIIVHDSMPHNDIAASHNPSPGKGWCGTVFRSIWKLRMNRDDLEIFTFPYNVGFTFIRPGKNVKYFNPKFPHLKMSYEYFATHKPGILNFKPWEWIIEHV